MAMICPYQIVLVGVYLNTDRYFRIGGNAVSATSKIETLPRFFFSFGVIPLLFIAGVQLFILSGQTDRYFAWTIPLPFTAAFMGAGYWAALTQAFVIVRKPSWERMRVSLPAGMTATTLLLIATLLHLDQFHLDSPAMITRFVTWVWIIVYIVTPPIFIYLFVTQYVRAEYKTGRQNPYPGWIRYGFYLLAIYGLITGIGLFFFPDTMIPLWPWNLAPLASRAVGVWLSTFGVVAAVISREDDRDNTAGAFTSLLAFCILQFVVLIRYPASVDFASPFAWSYLIFLLLGMIVTGVGLLKRDEDGYKKPPRTV